MRQKLLAIIALVLISSTLASAETIASKLTKLDTIKNDLKTSIESKGQTITTFDTYASAIASISGDYIAFTWNGGSDWTIATSSANVLFYNDLPALASEIMDVDDTNVASFCAVRIPLFNYTILSEFHDNYDHATFTQKTEGTIGTYTSGASVGGGGDSYVGGVVMPTGKVCFIPHVSDKIGIYDYTNNLFTLGPTAVTTDYAFWGGVLLPNGKVCMIPRRSSYVGIYDPVANLYIQGPEAAFVNDAYFGGVLLPNGKVCMIPANSDYIGIYDPVANTYTQGPAAVSGDYAFSGGVLMPNGKVCLVPRNSDYIGIYDPVANTYTQGPLAVSVNSAFAGGVILPTGNVCLIPGSSGYVGLYDNGFAPVPIDACMHPLINRY